MVTAEGIAGDRTVSIATSEWLPYCGNFLPNYGIEPEIVTAAYSRKGYTVKFDFMAWTRVLEDVRDGKYDAATSASFTEERAKEYFYSESYMQSPIVFYRRTGEAIHWNRLEDLKLYKIGVVRGYSYSPGFDKADFLQKKEAPTDILNIKKLLLKQADLIVMDQMVGHYIINNKLSNHERNNLEVMYPPLISDKLHLMFSKKAPDVSEKIAAFNDGLKEIREDGTLQKIMEKNGLKNKEVSKK
jgi:polar amino acid transport system substrate-binding protein